MPNATNDNARMDGINRLLNEVYEDEDDARAFLENPQPACLGLMGTEDQFTTPAELIERGGESEQRVVNYLRSRNGFAPTP